jgi:hypothetical protein
MRSLALLLAVLVTGCGASSSADSGGSFAPGTGGTTGTGLGGGVGTGSGGSAGAGASGGSGGAPEQELESSFQAPVATGRFVWIANPSSGRVAYIDAASLEVKTVAAGNGPTYVAPVPGATNDDAVVVLNVLSNDATFLRATAAGIDNRTYPGLPPTANSWALSPDGRWAIAWTDVRRVANPRATDGFQDATVLDLQAADPSSAHTTLAVGFRPVSFTFAADSTRAFAVTEDGVSVVAVGGSGGPVVTADVPVAADPNASSDTLDVSITADGRLAVVRTDGVAAVSVVDLSSGARTDIPMSAPVTDVDVSDDGARAVAVARDTAEVAIIPLGGAAPDPAAVARLTITGETVGSVVLTAGGSAAVLFSNAVPVEHLTVVTLGATPDFHVVRLHAPVLSVFPTDDGKFAVALHPGTVTAGTTPAATGFSLVPLDGTQPARIQTADAPITGVALSPAGDRTLIAERDDTRQIFGVYLGRFPTLEVQRYPLASPPLTAGVIAGAGRGYVAQVHPEGRITFVTLDSGDARTLTGYELAARVVDWSQP